MDNNLIESAINSALRGDWKQAILTNKKLFKLDPNDTDALNRLAKAYCENGEINLAKKTTLLTLKIDPNDQIALKALDKYKNSLNSKNKEIKNNKQSINQIMAGLDFIEESGTTKQTHLINVSKTGVISTLSTGDEVKLIPNGHRVAVNTLNNKYIGRLPDDLSAIIKKLVKNKYKYKTLIKSISKDGVKIFIREVQKGNGFENVKSFPKEISESFSEFSS